MLMGEVLPKLNPESIIIRMPNWVGDLVMATPVIAELRSAYPNAKITVMVRKPLGELLETDPNVDEVFSFRSVAPFWRRFAKRDIISKIQQGKFDLGVLLTNSFSSAWWFWKGGVKRRIGFAGNGRRWLLTDPVPKKQRAKTRHLVKIYKDLLIPLGIKPAQTSPRLYIDDREVEHAWQLLLRLGVHPSDCIIGINPGAAYGEAKCWLPERFTAVAKQLVEKHCKVLFFGDMASKSNTDAMCRDLPTGVVNMAGMTSLRELMALLQICRLLLTNDSGPMHIAAALGTHVVALFGSTSPDYTRPYQSGHVICKNVSCSPCFKRQCPIDFKCMKQISVDEVVAAINPHII